VVIDDLYIKCITALEPKTETPLIVDANAPLTNAITDQLLQSVGGRQSQIIDSCGCIQLQQAHDCAFSNLPRDPPGLTSREQAFCFTVGEGQDHIRIINILFMSVKIARWRVVENDSSCCQRGVSRIIAEKFDFSALRDWANSSHYRTPVKARISAEISDNGIGVASHDL
jgi:hypothetical protein